MLKVKCIQKFRDKHNIIIGYRLTDSSGNIKDVTPKQLKQVIAQGKLEVINLMLTSDGRLRDIKSSLSETPKHAPVVPPEPTPVVPTEPTPVVTSAKPVPALDKVESIECFYLYDQKPKYALLSNGSVLPINDVIELIKNNLVDKDVNNKMCISFDGIDKYKKYALCVGSIYERVKDKRNDADEVIRTIPGMKPKGDSDNLLFNKGIVILSDGKEITLVRDDIPKLSEIAFIPNIHIKFTDTGKMILNFEPYNSQNELNKYIEAYTKLFRYLNLEQISLSDISDFYSVKLGKRITKYMLIGEDRQDAINKAKIDVNYQLKFNDDKTVVTGIEISDEYIHTSIEIPSCVREIADNAFEDTRIEKVHFNSNIDRIGKQAFKHCIYLKDINLEMVTGRIEEEGFSLSGLQKLTTNAVYIGRKAFSNCGVRKGKNQYGIMEIGDCPNVEEIGNEAFTYLSSISGINNITNNGKLKKIGYKAFYCDYNAGVSIKEEINLSRSLEEISDYAFKINTSSYNVLGNNTYIGHKALNYCSDPRKNPSKVHINSNSPFLTIPAIRADDAVIRKYQNDTKDIRLTKEMLDQLENTIVVTKLSNQINDSYKNLGNNIFLMNNSNGISYLATSNNAIVISKLNMDKYSLSKKVMFFDNILVINEVSNYKLDNVHGFSDARKYWIEHGEHLNKHSKDNVMFYNIFSNNKNSVNVQYANTMNEILGYIKDYDPAEKFIASMDNINKEFIWVKFDMSDLGENKPILVTMDNQDFYMTWPMFYKAYHNIKCVNITKLDHIPDFTPMKKMIEQIKNSSVGTKHKIEISHDHSWSWYDGWEYKQHESMKPCWCKIDNTEVLIPNYLYYKNIEELIYSKSK